VDSDTTDSSGETDDFFNYRQNVDHLLGGPGFVNILWKCTHWWKPWCFD